MITQEQVSAYREHGYLVVPDLLGASELEALRVAVAAVESAASALLQANDRFQLEAELFDGRFVANAVADPILDHPNFFQILSLPYVLDVVEGLLGTPNVKLHHTKLFMKYPGSPWSIHWHQDFSYLLHCNFDLLAVMFMLDGSDDENGGLEVLPGSHREGPIEVTSPEGGWMIDLAPWAAGRQVESLPVPPGGASFHHCCLVHSSRPNRSTRPRRAFIVQYSAADNHPIAGRTNYAGYGTILRGNDPRRVRCVEGEWRIPPTRIRRRHHQ